MKTFTTEKGTTLPILDLKGKDYLQVAHRVQWFREVHPLGWINTKILEKTDKFVTAEAEIYTITEDQKTHLKIANAFKTEHFAHFGDALEKACTGAIGRALALCGFGTQFTYELDEQDRVVDAPMTFEKPMVYPKVGEAESISSWRPEGPEHRSFMDVAFEVKPKLDPYAPSTFPQFEDVEAAANHVCKAPKNKNYGKTVREIPDYQLENDVKYWRDREKKDGKPLSGQLESYLVAAETYIRAMSEPKSSNGSTWTDGTPIEFDTKEQLPF